MRLKQFIVVEMIKINLNHSTGRLQADRCSRATEKPDKSSPIPDGNIHRGNIEKK
jgi:hypothetical protein